MISSGALPQIEEQFRLYGIDLGGRLAFNGTLNGALKDPIVSGHAELGSLIVNRRDLGSLAANIASTASETRVTEGRLIQSNGGGAHFALVIPRAGEDNVSIDATLDRMNGEVVLALAESVNKGLIPGGTTIDSDISGQIKITGIPNNMSGVADVRFAPGKINGESLQNLTAHATFSGTIVNLDKFDASLTAGHIIGSGKFDTATRAFCSYGKRRPPPTGSFGSASTTPQVAKARRNRRSQGERQRKRLQRHYDL